MPKSVTFFPDKGAKAIAIVRGQNSNGTALAGIITFEQTDIDSPILIKVNVSGLLKTSNTTKHGFHVHQSGISIVADTASQSNKM